MRRIWIPQLTASAMLLWALNPGNPYGYYVLLRWICCVLFVFLATQAFVRNKYGWVWTFGILTGIYNPIFRVHLNRETWSIINVLTMLVALASIYALRTKDEAK
jgi:hypothetical protein